MNLLLCGQWDPQERDEWAEWLRGRLGPGQVLHLGREGTDASAIEVAIVANPPPGSLMGLPRLRLIQSLWAGVDRLLGDATLPPGVPLARMVDPSMSAAMAETALWAVLSQHRDFMRYAAQQRERLWQPHAQWRADEWPVLVLGFGEMGRTVADRLARQGYPVLAWSRTRAAQDVAGVRAVHGDEALRTVLAEARTVINLLPLTEATRGLLDRRFFASMRPGAGLVNLGRGAHLNEADLLAALNEGRVGHAVLDVFAHEPLADDHAFWRHPQVSVLPHVAAQTDPRTAVQVVLDNLQALAEGRPLAHLVDRARGY